MLIDYPESKFGGFLAVTDYKDPVILDEIKSQRLGLWPPIRYSYDTINKDYPGRKGQDELCLGYPAPPPWASSAPLCDAPPDQLARFNALGNTNWLGLDNQGRDVVARVIYGFRISVLFGLLLAIVLGRRRRRGRRRAGLFRRPHRPHLPALPGDLVVDPLAVRADHHLVGAGARLLDAARRRCCCSSGSTSSASCAPSSCARATSSTSRAARALGLSHRKIMWKHMLPNAMVATLTFLPFQLSGSDRGADGARLPRPRPAARIAVARRAAAAGQAASGGAVARPHRLLLRRAHAVAADLHRRGRARRARSPQDVPVGAAMASVDRALLDVRDLSVAFRAQRRDDRCRSACRSASARARRWRSSASPAPARPFRRCRSCSLLPYPAASHPSGEIWFEGRTSSS